MEFALTLVKVLQGEENAKKVAKDVVYSYE